MKLSSNTITLLENYASINGNLIITPGNMLKTMHACRTIFANAQVEEVFDRTFGIYDLKEFLATLAMFKNPDLTFNDQYVDIVDEDDPTIHTKYWSADTDILTQIPELTQLPSPSVVFNISNINFKRIQKAAAVLKCPDIVFEGKDGKIVAKVCNLTNATKNDFTVVLEDNFTGEDFNVHLKQDKLMIINGDYRCELIMNKIIELNHTEREVKYLITLDVN